LNTFHISHTLFAIFVPGSHGRVLDVEEQRLKATIALIELIVLYGLYGIKELATIFALKI
jgi:hypothetical protein